jgi:hypothetical protein
MEIAKSEPAPLTRAAQSVSSKIGPNRWRHWHVPRLSAAMNMKAKILGPLVGLHRATEFSICVLLYGGSVRLSAVSRLWSTTCWQLDVSNLRSQLSRLCEENPWLRYIGASNRENIAHHNRFWVRQICITYGLAWFFLMVPTLQCIPLCIGLIPEYIMLIISMAREYS